MELGIVLIGIATFLNSVVLARFLYSNRDRAVPEPTQSLPFVYDWQVDAADEVEELAPAAVTATNENPVEVVYSPWKNVSGIQQGVNAAPAPPIVQQPLPPLARPAGFV